MLERQVQDVDGVAEAVVEEDVSLTSPAAQHHHTCLRELPQPDTLQHAIRKKGLPVKMSNLRMSLLIPFHCFLLSLSFICQPYPSLLTPLIKSWLCVLLPQSGNIIVVGVIMIELKNHSTTCADGVPRQSEVRMVVVEC